MGALQALHMHFIVSDAVIAFQFFLELLLQFLLSVLRNTFCSSLPCTRISAAEKEHYIMLRIG